jgi:hypothetical protein
LAGLGIGAEQKFYQQSSEEKTLRIDREQGIAAMTQV